MISTIVKGVSQQRFGTGAWKNQPYSGPVNGKVCKFWLSGNCTRNPCRFLHPEKAAPVGHVKPLNGVKSKLANGSVKQFTYKRASNEQSHPKWKQQPVVENAVVKRSPGTLNEGGTRKSVHLRLGQSHDLRKQPEVTSEGVNDEHNHQKRKLHTNTLPATRNQGAPTDEENHPKRKQRVFPQNPADVCSSTSGRHKEDGVIGVINQHLNRLPSASRKNAAVECSPVTHDEGVSQKVQPKICEDWVKNSCVNGEKCNSVHSWSIGEGLSLLAQLQGHTKGITGIALPSGSDKLFTGSKDGTVRVWSCHTGECTAIVSMGASVESLISEGPWVFAGVKDAVKAWNIQTDAQLSLRAPAGQIHALATSDDNVLFGGAQDGSILMWNYNSEAASFKATALLKGHTDAVVSLAFGSKKLFSGSMDNTIRVWDLEKKLICVQTLRKHSEVVTAMVCWDQFLLSSSLDKSLKTWAKTEAGELDVVHAQNEDHGVLSLSGMSDGAGKPILLSSCNDNSVHLYELPTFVERGRIFARQEVQAVQVGPEGLIFTGDSTGLVSVWRYSGDQSTSPDKTA